MAAYLVPTGDGEAKFTEKRSRFIGRVWRTEAEEDALSRIADMKKQHWDATHNVYAYIIKDGAVRYSDDGEPGGTAGMPVLNVLQRASLYNVCCVVTRYFGGTLLGAGGLVRAYGKAAKLAVDQAGVSEMRLWTALTLPCPYSLLDRVKLETAAFGGQVETADYAADVTLTLCLPEEQTDEFLTRITELSAGTVRGTAAGQKYKAFPAER